MSSSATTSPTSINLDRKVLDSIDMRSFLAGQSNVPEEWTGASGKEHYRLLSYLGSQFRNASIVDIGTHMGVSALALSQGVDNNNRVVTFDIVDKLTPERRAALDSRNVTRRISDLWNAEIREENRDLLLNADLILLDVDPHNGTMEWDFYQWLVQNDYRGLLLCDDVWFFKEMRDNFWYKIPQERRSDLSYFGHWSGTGLVNCARDGAPNKILIEGHLVKPVQDPTKNWTFVTAYFDLTECADASNEIRARDSEYYLSHANATLNLPYNLVVYCSAKDLPRVQERRPAELASKTIYRVMEFDDIPFVTADRQQIIENRRRKPYAFDARNTASYYLFCVSRCWMLLNEIERNEFHSTHFSWINFCIERMGYQNLMHMDEIVATYRNKFSTVFIDYIPKGLVFNWPEFWKYGRCSLCSGFYTGDAYHMKEFCTSLLSTYREMLDMGYGHADEQLFIIVYHRRPELFEWFLGDYQQMITNYAGVYDAIDRPIQLLISRSFSYKDYHVTHRACDLLMSSLDQRHSGIPSNLLGVFLRMYLLSSIAVGNVESINRALQVIMSLPNDVRLLIVQ